jgi:DNA-binding response OmpR family regulator
MYTMTAAMHLVLIVEDDTALQSVLRTLFEASGYRVVSAAIATGGIHDARLHNPDIAIVDLGLPDRDGIEVIKGIRTWSAMPIVVLTARTAEAQRLLAFESGADDYIVKRIAPACPRRFADGHPKAGRYFCRSDWPHRPPNRRP